jgi:hypothetical protein
MPTNISLSGNLITCMACVPGNLRGSEEHALAQRRFLALVLFHEGRKFTNELDKQTKMASSTASQGCDKCILFWKRFLVGRSSGLGSPRS